MAPLGLYAQSVDLRKVVVFATELLRLTADHKLNFSGF